MKGKVISSFCCSFCWGYDIYRTSTFLDTQSSLNKTFGLTPTMIQIIKHAKRQCTIEETNYLASKVFAFCNLCCLHIFCNSV